MNPKSKIKNPESETPNLKNAYTDSPTLQPNLLLGSLQLVFWLLFHPSAWRNHIARIDPTLRPDFCLAELSGTQWRSPALYRLLIMGYVIWPVLVGLLVGLILWVLGISGGIIAFGIAFGVMGGVAFGIAFGATVGMMAGLVGIVVFGVMGGVAFGVARGAYNVMIEVMGGPIVDTARDVAVGIMGSVAGSMVGQRAAYSFARQMGGVIVGVLVGVAVVGAVIVVAIIITGDVVAFSVTAGVAVGLAVGWRTRRWRRGVLFCVLFGLAFGVVRDIAYGVAIDMAVGVAVGVAFGTLFSALFALPYVLTERVAGPWAGAVAGALGSAGGGVALVITVYNAPLWPRLPLSLVSILLGLSLAWWRPVLLYPLLTVWNLLLYRADERRANSEQPSLLRWHSAFWDEHQRLPLFGLEDHLLLVMERNPVEGQTAVEYLNTSHQRWAAQATQIELDARNLERCTDLETIRHAQHRLAAGELAGPASALLRSLSRISQDVDAALHQTSAYNQRLALSAVEDRLDGLLRELTRSSERYAARFRPIATRWRQIVASEVRKLAEAVEIHQEINNPYVIGVPLTEQQEIFIGRIDISARIEQLLLDQRRSPLLLYGQRRMGKTSLLNNLGRLLSSAIIPLFVDLQGPASQARDHTGFLYNIARGMVRSARQRRNLILPALSREVLAVDPFTRFDEWLDEVEQAIGQSTVLLTLDEFEALDSVLASGRFSETDVLGMLRHLIQHRPRFKVLLAGSHTLDELQRWANYLINVQTVHISYLKEIEARQLVERPIKEFALRYEPEASQRVLDLTRGHPFLVQLLCAEIVSLKNEQDPTVRRLGRLADVEAAIPKALISGSFFFANIERNQVDPTGLALLRCLAVQEEGAVVSRETLARHIEQPLELDQTLTLLTRRELIEAVEGGYRFQVELIRRWFA